MAWRSVVVLSGGVGGARLVSGLSRVLDPAVLTVIVNTADDFEHWGLPICPDLDTVMYTLADLGDSERGWGLRDETFDCLRMMQRYGADDWFQLGDRDLATHVFRAQRFSSGATLSQVTTELCHALGVATLLLPMTDGVCRTLIETNSHGTLPFQQWLVRHRAPAARAVRFQGQPAAAPGVLGAIAAAQVVIVTPSNPYVSIDPILHLEGVREAIAERPTVAVSPIVSGRAIKGPLGEMIVSLAGRDASAAAVAAHYAGLLNGFVVHPGDDAGISEIAVSATDIVMRSDADRVRLARDVLAFAATLP